MRPRSVILVAILLTACGGASEEGDRGEAPRSHAGGRAMTFTLTSPSFDEGGMIPSKFTCDGNDGSPELSWSGAPEETGGFALICDDPDAPGGDWVHWVIFDLPPACTGLPEDVSPSELPDTGGTARTAGAASATADRAHPAGPIGTTSSSTPWTVSCAWTLGRQRPTSSRPWKAMCWPRLSSWGATGEGDARAAGLLLGA